MKPGDTEHVAIWDAINGYAESCGGTAGAQYGNIRRMDAVCDVEAALRDVIANVVAEERARCLAACQEVYNSLMAKSLSKVPLALVMRKIEGGK